MSKRYKVNLLDELKPHVDIPFSDKYVITKSIIARNLREHRGKAVVAWSGGKDSTLVLYLVRQLEPDVSVVFNNTGVEYPETVAYIRELADAWKLNFFETHPDTTFWKVGEKFGYPGGTKHGQKKIRRGTASPHCCYYLKEKPMFDIIREKGFTCSFDGVTAVESWVRMFVARDKGTCYTNKHWDIKKVKPILYWTEDEVFQFFHDERILLNPLYERGMTRVGCMPCTSYKTWEEDLRRENPKLYSIVKFRKDGYYQLTRQAIETLHSSGLKVALLTKAGPLAARDFDLLERVKLTQLRFAFDEPGMATIFTEKIRLVQETGLCKQPFIYVLVGFNTTFDEDLERLNLIRRLGCRAYVMRYDTVRLERRYNELARWANMFWSFAKYDFQEFVRVVRQ